MNRKQKIVFFSGLGVVVALIVLIIVLLVNDRSASNSGDEDSLIDKSEQVDSLQNAYDELELVNEYKELEADFSQYEEQQKYLKNDTLVRQYNDAKKRVESLLKELKSEKRSNQENREKIKQLQAEIATLKDIVRHYLEEIKRLGEENEGLKHEIEQVSARNQELSSQVTAANASNERLAQTVSVAKKLNITGLSMTAYNKGGKPEKKIKKAMQLGVNFTVAPNNTASPGKKTFYVRVLSPEGSLVGGGPSFTIDGAHVQSSGSRQAEYDNGELRVTVYVNVSSSLTPGSYTVEAFCDGNRLGSTHVTMKN